MYKITIEKNKKATCVLVKEKDIFNEKYMILLIKKCVNVLNKKPLLDLDKIKKQSFLEKFGKNIEDMTEVELYKIINNEK